MAICKNCDHGVVMETHRHIVSVTRDMAIDAGMPDMEGATWDWGTEYTAEPCECCHGDFENCDNCEEDNNEHS